jgi:hypothetical protein
MIDRNCHLNVNIIKMFIIESGSKKNKSNINIFLIAPKFFLHISFIPIIQFEHQYHLFLSFSSYIIVHLSLSLKIIYT